MRGIKIMVSDRGFRSSPTARNLRLRPHRGDPIRRLEPTSLRNAGGLATKHVGAPRSRGRPDGPRLAKRRSALARRPVIQTEMLA